MEFEYSVFDKKIYIRIPVLLLRTRPLSQEVLHNLRAHAHRDWAQTLHALCVGPNTSRNLNQRLNRSFTLQLSHRKIASLS